LSDCSCGNWRTHICRTRGRYLETKYRDLTRVHGPLQAGKGTTSPIGMRYTIRQTSKYTLPHRQTDERIPKAEWREQTLEVRHRSETFNVLKHSIQRRTHRTRTLPSEAPMGHRGQRSWLAKGRRQHLKSGPTHFALFKIGTHRHREIGAFKSPDTIEPGKGQ